MRSLSSPVDQGRSEERPSLAQWLGSAFCAVIALSLLVVLWNRPINHDTAWYLIATRDWLAGAELYVDIVEVNPPLAFYLTIPAVVLAESLPIGLVNAQYTLIATLLWISLTMIWRVSGVLATEKRIVLLLAASAALVVPFLSSIAQREHLMVVFMLPWITGRIVLGASASGETGRALFAALGICIKPFFVLYPLAITCLDVWHTRSPRPIVSPSNLVFLGVGLGYVGLVALRHPTYLTDIIPVARDVYQAYGLDDAAVLRPLFDPVMLLGLVCVLATARTVPGGGNLAAAAGAGLAIYLIQWTGYNYQFLPILSFVLLGAGLILVHARIASLAGVLALAVAVAVIVPFVRTGFHSAEATDVLARAILDSGGSERLNVVSTTLPPGPAVALATGADWTSRYPALWLVPGAVNGLAATDCTSEPDRCARLRAIRDRTREEIVSDLVDGQPDTLVFDTRYLYILVADFDWITFLSEDEGFRDFMGDYGPPQTVGPFRIHRRQG